ncbi:MAG: winged helix-turn-helix domain-containing protein, partial [Undibacterium sp.]|nr:winged helix-turn-helix domain-containing protein [Undibacterium sp.]
MNTTMNLNDIKFEQAQSEKAESAWPVLSLERNKQHSLVDQIVDAITLLVSKRELRIGTKMPSVRQLAKCNGISTFTVVEAYGHLVSCGLLSSRPGSGYVVARNEV